MKEGRKVGKSPWKIKMKGGWNEASRPNEKRKVENKGIGLGLNKC